MLRGDLPRATFSIRYISAASRDADGAGRLENPPSEELKGPFTFHFGQRRSLSASHVSSPSCLSFLPLRFLFLLPFHRLFLALLISLFFSYFRSSFFLFLSLSLSIFISFRLLQPSYFCSSVRFRLGSYAITFPSLLVPRLF